MSTTTRRKRAAKKAVATRRARNLFRKTYPDTALIAEELLTGYDVEDIAWDNDVSVRTVAAVKANLNRVGPFSDLAAACNF
jgi:hypothetical protein